MDEKQIIKRVYKEIKPYRATMIVAMICMLSFLAITYRSPKDLLFLAAFIPLLIHIRTVARTKNPELLDPELKKVALTTFLLSILFSLSQIL